MDITPISKEAFAVLAECEETRKPFGITIDPNKYYWENVMNARRFEADYQLSQLDKPVDKAYTHYSNFDLKKNGYIRNGGLEVNKMFSMRDLTNSSDALASLQTNISKQGTSADSGYYDRIRIPMNMPYKAKDGKTYKNYGTYVIRSYYDHPEYFQNSYWFVHNVCPGFNFEITDGMGVMANVFAISFNIFYNFDKSGTSTKTSIYLATTPEVMQTSHIINDRDALEQLVNDNSCTYIKSPAGIFTEVTLPIDEITAAHANDSLLSVSIAFSRENSGLKASPYLLKAPSTIIMLPTDSLQSFFEEDKEYDNKSTFVTTLGTNNNYTFSNIGNLITLLSKNKAAGLASDPDWVNKHPNWNKVLLVPVSVTTSSSASVAVISNLMGLGSTKLVGGKDHPISMKVIFARFKNE